LLSGQVDILADIFMTNEYPVLQGKLDQKLNTLIVGDWGFRPIGYTLVTTDKMIQQKPDLLKRFDAGAAKGFQFTIDQPDKAAEIAAAAYPQTLLPAITRGQVHELVDFLKRGEPKQLFLGGDQAWAQTVAVLKDSGVISEAKPAGVYYTNDFVPPHE
jgi:NitT/TauT family transport system substrate-binding protein